MSRVQHDQPLPCGALMRRPTHKRKDQTDLHVALEQAVGEARPRTHFAAELRLTAVHVPLHISEHTLKANVNVQASQLRSGHLPHAAQAMEMCSAPLSGHQ